jgi:hypothetical protein
MVNDLSDLLLDSVYHYILRIFASMFIQEIGLSFFFLDVSLSCLGMSVILVSYNELGSVTSFPFWFMENPRTVGISSSLKFW